MRAIGIAIFAGVFLAIVYAVFDLRHDHNQTNRIGEECQCLLQSHDDRRYTEPPVSERATSTTPVITI